MLEAISHELLPAKIQDEGLSIVVSDASSLDASYIHQLIDKSRQPHIRLFEEMEDIGTPETPGRFRTVQDYRSWANGKHRLMFMLIDNDRVVDEQGTADIGSVAWFGKRQNKRAPGRTVTFSMRNYAEDGQRNWAQYTGRGLAVPFMLAAHQAALDTYQNESVWLDLFEGNNASHKMCIRAGYNEIARHNDDSHHGQARIVMVNDTIFTKPT